MDELKSINWGHTIFSNFVNILFVLMYAFVIIRGIEIIQKITDVYIQSTVLILFMIMVLKYMRPRWTMVYNIENGIARYD
jgi:hypothetical protein